MPRAPKIVEVSMILRFAKRLYHEASTVWSRGALGALTKSLGDELERHGKSKR